MHTEYADVLQDFQFDREASQRLRGDESVLPQSVKKFKGSDKGRKNSQSRSIKLETPDQQTSRAGDEEGEEEYGEEEYGEEEYGEEEYGEEEYGEEEIEEEVDGEEEITGKQDGVSKFQPGIKPVIPQNPGIPTKTQVASANNSKILKPAQAESFAIGTNDNSKNISGNQHEPSTMISMHVQQGRGFLKTKELYTKVEVPNQSFDLNKLNNDLLTLIARRQKDQTLAPPKPTQNVKPQIIKEPEPILKTIKAQKGRISYECRRVRQLGLAVIRNNGGVTEGTPPLLPRPT